MIDEDSFNNYQARTTGGRKTLKSRKSKKSKTKKLCNI